MVWARKKMSTSLIGGHQINREMKPGLDGNKSGPKPVNDYKIKKCVKKNCIAYTATSLIKP